MNKKSKVVDKLSLCIMFIIEIAGKIPAWRECTMRRFFMIFSIVFLACDDDMSLEESEETGPSFFIPEIEDTDFATDTSRPVEYDTETEGETGRSLETGGDTDTGEIPEHDTETEQEQAFDTEDYTDSDVDSDVDTDADTDGDADGDTGSLDDTESQIIPDTYEELDTGTGEIVDRPTDDPVGTESLLETDTYEEIPSGDSDGDTDTDADADTGEVESDTGVPDSTDIETETEFPSDTEVPSDTAVATDTGESVCPLGLSYPGPYGGLEFPDGSGHCWYHSSDLDWDYSGCDTVCSLLGVGKGLDGGNVHVPWDEFTRTFILEDPDNCFEIADAMEVIPQGDLWDPSNFRISNREDCTFPLNNTGAAGCYYDGGELFLKTCGEDENVITSGHKITSGGRLCACDVSGIPADDGIETDTGEDGFCNGECSCNGLIECEDGASCVFNWESPACDPVCPENSECILNCGDGVPWDNCKYDSCQGEYVVCANNSIACNQIC